MFSFRQLEKQMKHQVTSPLAPLTVKQTELAVQAAAKMNVLAPPRQLLGRKSLRVLAKCTTSVLETSEKEEAAKQQCIQVLVRKNRLHEREQRSSVQVTLAVLKQQHKLVLQEQSVQHRLKASHKRWWLLGVDWAHDRERASRSWLWW